MTRLPAEWEAQSAVIIAWPHAEGDFGGQLADVEQTYCLIARAVFKRQRLIIICKDNVHQAHIQAMLTLPCSFIQAPVDDIWVRDTAPLTVATGTGHRLLNFRFNGWGKKYPYHADNALHRYLFQSPCFANVPTRDIDMVLEGGSIEADGQGTLLTTRQCLLNPNRNPQLSKQQIEQALQRYLGIERCLWLDQENLAGDDTDAHIDTLARFCSPEHIAYTSCTNPDDPHFAGLKNMQAQLQKFTTPSGNPYKLTALPLPAPVYDCGGQRLPANYANFLIINNAVLVPVYNDPLDNFAVEQLSACFPEREIIAIPCLPLVHQFGSLHCMSMQIPEAVVKSC